MLFRSLDGARLKLWPVVTHGPSLSLRPGEVSVSKSAVAVGTATHPVELGEVQQAGKRRMAAVEWARGLRLGAAGPGTVVLH